MKKILCFLIAITLCAAFVSEVFARESDNKSDAVTAGADFTVDAKSAILMEAGTGKILFSQNENESASPASVTKIMTLLLVMEAREDGRISASDNVVISGYAASMGGSQVFLEEGEVMKVEELVKCAVIASANDAAVALAEHVGGSEKIFVGMMNKRAEELGMKNTNFENVTGLDDTTENHVTSALDIAIMSRELIKYPLVLKYSSLWQDTIRGGEFTLTNTNRLVRYYDGCNGLKTGSTDKAGYCISATAKRDGMQLIAVIMGSPTRDIRNSAARSLLDYGFSNYAIYSSETGAVENVPVYKGNKNQTTVYSSEFSAVIPKKELKKVEKIFEIPEYLTAPVSDGEAVGKITYKLGDEIIGTSDIYVSECIDKISFFDLFKNLLENIFVN